MKCAADWPPRRPRRKPGQWPPRGASGGRRYNGGVMPQMPSCQSLHWGGFALAVGGLAVAVFFMQGVLGLAPCPLCILDRWVTGLAAAVFLAAALHNPGALGQRLYAGLGLLACAAGLGLAGRHVWLQNLPPGRVPDCTPGLDYLLEQFPPMEVLRTVLNSAGECAEVAWTFAGLTIPQQTLLFFGALALVCAAVLLKTRGAR